MVVWNVITRNESGFRLEGFSARGFTIIDYDSQKAQRFRSGWNPPVVKGWQLLGASHNLSTPLEQMIWIKHSPREVLKQGAFGEVADINTRMQMTQFITSIFYLNASIPKSEPDLVLYNSTLWYNGTRISLEASLLEFTTWYVLFNPAWSRKCS